MTTTVQFQTQVKNLIDSLKGICSNYGLGNSGDEYIIITQTFLYKFLNDKFAYEVKQLNPELAKADNWQKAIEQLSEEEYEMLTLQLSADTAVLKPHHFISHLFGIQNTSDFALTFDDTLMDIAIQNNDIFSVVTTSGSKEPLFERISEKIDEGDRNAFAKAVINQLVDFSFEHIFNEKYDFYATIFEYLIKDYNNDSGGTYAEYYTPHAVAKIMASILVTEDNIQDVTCYDPSAGSGTLLMNLAHAIGEDKCTIYSQDVSKKSSKLLRLNLILNNLVHSLQNVVRGNTILAPYHKDDNGQLQKFDYIVSNPPFKLDFSEYRDDLDSKENNERFFAGIPNIPKKKKESMAIYTLFLQHIIHSLTKTGKAAIVVPTGFITAQGIDKKIRQKLIKNKMLAGVVSMPSNIFASTGTNVSIIFLDKNNTDEIVLIDASNLGTKVKEGKNQKTVLSEIEEERIIDVFNKKEVVDDFSVVVSIDEIKNKNYSLSAGQYFDIKIEYVDISNQEFEEKITSSKQKLNEMFLLSKDLEKNIEKNLSKLVYGE
ncbi:class I SAM-dependent DNA methyltransferase [Winogradskyella sp. SYSU M77433]|uniref:HsdM family class I SAM-dependent methyltransferase n=1 Tax=Winogradskyella sp. SYSU M77433 TaxID=3042722 RepID=UPI00248172DE|nr:class I SAM-dependent DNA methyltransferase [Winogradskyella sp. SYSU M77433]MDH7914333.1 class I SAM-dependent DNA methyltransferase [Winogradskyella sp. SYSU M77433]